jgi:pectin methylesterase-like acyl-CoA thioesterase
MRADVFVVSPDGSGDFPTIQAAVDAASDGDDIELTDGVSIPKTRIT